MGPDAAGSLREQHEISGGGAQSWWKHKHFLWCFESCHLIFVQLCISTQRCLLLAAFTVKSCSSPTSAKSTLRDHSTFRGNEFTSLPSSEEKCRFGSGSLVWSCEQIRQAAVSMTEDFWRCLSLLRSKRWWTNVFQIYWNKLWADLYVRVLR